MKLIVDMNLSPRWAGLLNSSGFQSIHWSAVGPANARDSDIMVYAAANNYVILTHDLDFSAIPAVTHGERPSVAQIRADDVSPDVIGLRVISALQQMETELEVGALLTIEPDRNRLRLLPLKEK